MILRKNAALVIINSDKKILAGKRRDFDDAWQIPQGGVDDGEDFIDAAWRELLEETGFSSEDCKLLNQTSEITYILPPEIVSKRGFHGQTQVYFLFQLVSDKKPCENEEFSDFAWLTPAEIIEKVVDFKKDSYKKAFNQLFGENFI